jgi:hypothetical protein
MTSDPHVHGIRSAKKGRSLQGVGGFLKRHRRALAVLGTCILFFTFVFREVLREKARATKDNYDSAEELFSILDAFVNLNDRIRHVEVVIESQPNNYVESQHTLRTSAELRLIDLENSIRNLERICKTLTKPPFSGDIEVLKTKVTTLVAKMPDRLESFSPYSLSNFENKTDYDALVNQIAALQVQVRDKTPKILAALKEESAAAAANYQLFDTASLALYTLGVIVTVIGQVVGNEDEKSIK